MSAMSSAELASEVRDLLDVGPVGLYEFRWVLAGKGVRDARKQVLVAGAALDELRAEGHDLAWVEWPTMDVLRSETRPGSALPIEVWDDPTEGEPLLAIVPRLGHPES